MPFHMKKEQYKKFFDEADTDNDNFLTYKELKQMIQKYKYPFQEDRLTLQFQLADMNGDNKLSFDEFLVAMEYTEVTKSQETRLRRVFEIFDKDKSSAIDAGELQQAVKQLLNKSISDKQAKKMLKSVDIDRNGTINFEEFVEIMRGHFKDI